MTDVMRNALKFWKTTKEYNFEAVRSAKTGLWGMSAYRYGKNTVTTGICYTHPRIALGVLLTILSLTPGAA